MKSAALISASYSERSLSVSVPALAPSASESIRSWTGVNLQTNDATGGLRVEAPAQRLQQAVQATCKVHAVTVACAPFSR